MDNMECLCSKYEEDMEKISLKLSSLHSMVDTINVALQHECIEQQVVNCMDCIGYCISDIKNTVDIQVKQLIETRKQVYKNNGHE